MPQTWAWPRRCRGDAPSGCGFSSSPPGWPGCSPYVGVASLPSAGPRVGGRRDRPGFSSTARRRASLRWSARAHCRARRTPGVGPRRARRGRPGTASGAGLIRAPSGPISRSPCRSSSSTRTNHPEIQATILIDPDFRESPGRGQTNRSGPAVAFSSLCESRIPRIPPRPAADLPTGRRISNSFSKTAEGNRNDPTWEQFPRRTDFRGRSSPGFGPSAQGGSK